MAIGRRYGLGLLVIAGVACNESTPPACTDVLFGSPNAMTGLTAEQCGPTCGCGDQPAWPAPVYSDADLAALRSLVLVDPPALLTADPYASPPAETAPDSYCAVVRGTANDYRLTTFPSRAEALAAGAIPTHAGACGLCSSLEDLAVYISQPDLTEPVRACGLMHGSGPADEHLQCLRDLGFTEPCAQIWYFNTQHTRARCLEACVLAIGEPYHTPDGALNACLTCDEVESGPVFKAVAGRTRRNTGVPSALCRPCSEVERLVHRY